jgi:phosphoribosyl 1,2-cyclic phosphate phosphodiesterase
LPIYAYPEVLEQIRERFRYMFGRTGRKGYYDDPALLPIEVPDRMRLGALDFEFFEQDHTVCRTLGIRVDGFAYSTDVKELPDPALEALAGLKVWVVAAVRREPHVAHAHLDQVLGWIDRLRPERALLTHLNHSMDYRTLAAELPDSVQPAHDGFVIEFDNNGQLIEFGDGGPAA